MYLRILSGQKGKPANLSTINERMIHKMSNTTRLVDKLIDKKVGSKRICAQNRRKIEIFITDRRPNLLKTNRRSTRQKREAINGTTQTKKKKKN